MAIHINLLNVVGEDHNESNVRRKNEFEQLFAKSVGLDYWTEDAFTTRDGRPGDPPDLKFIHILIEPYTRALNDLDKRVYIQSNQQVIKNSLQALVGEIKKYQVFQQRKHWNTSDQIIHRYKEEVYQVRTAMLDSSAFRKIKLLQAQIALTSPWHKRVELRRLLGDDYGIEGIDDIANDMGHVNTLGLMRSKAMFAAAYEAAATGMTGIWKVGQGHIEHMQKILDQKNFNLISRADFHQEIRQWLAVGLWRKSS